MKTIDVATADVVTLTTMYREAAKEHGAATELGDYQTANRQHDLIATIYAELRRRGCDAQRELLPLLDDMDAHVRVWVSAHALEFASERGESVLKQLASKSGIVDLNAQMTLQEWSKGTLTFP